MYVLEWYFPLIVPKLVFSASILYLRHLLKLAWDKSGLYRPSLFWWCQVMCWSNYSQCDQWKTEFVQKSDVFQISPKSLPTYIRATFVLKFITRNFQNLPHLVTLIVAITQCAINYRKNVLFYCGHSASWASDTTREDPSTSSWFHQWGPGMPLHMFMFNLNCSQSHKVITWVIRYSAL